MRWTCSPRRVKGERDRLATSPSFCSLSGSSNYSTGKCWFQPTSDSLPSHRPAQQVESSASFLAFNGNWDRRLNLSVRTALDDIEPLPPATHAIFRRNETRSNDERDRTVHRLTAASVGWPVQRCVRSSHVLVGVLSNGYWRHRPGRPMWTTQFTVTDTLRSYPRRQSRLRKRGSLDPMSQDLAVHRL